MMFQRLIPGDQLENTYAPLCGTMAALEFRFPSFLAELDHRRSGNPQLQYCANNVSAETSMEFIANQSADRRIARRVDALQPDDIEYRYHVHELQKFGIEETTIWSYTGDRMDYDQVVDGLMFARDKARRALEN